MPSDVAELLHRLGLRVLAGALIFALLGEWTVVIALVLAGAGLLAAESHVSSTVR
jgi:hypothetical protein